MQNLYTLCLYEFEFENSQAIFMSLYKNKLILNAYTIQKFAITKNDNECI